MGKHGHTSKEKDERSIRMALQKKGNPHPQREKRSERRSERSRHSPRRSRDNTPNHSPRENSRDSYHHHHHKRKLDHSHKYDPATHWKIPEEGAGSHHHAAATNISKLVRGGSARRIMEERKKAKDKMRAQQAKRRGSMQSAQDKHEERTTTKPKEVKQRIFDLSNQGDASNHIPDDYFDNEDERDSFGSAVASEGKNNMRVKHGKDKKGKNKKSKKSRAEEEAEEEQEQYKKATMAYEAKVAEAMEEGQITNDMAGRLLKKKKIEIYDDDDEETRAYKLKLNALAKEQHQVEVHHKEVHKIIEEPSRADDYKCFCYLGSFIGLYYGLCVWMLLQGGGLFILALLLGVVAPVMIIWLTCTWRKAKKEGKRAIFKW